MHALWLCSKETQSFTRDSGKQWEKNLFEVEFSYSRESPYIEVAKRDLGKFWCRLAILNYALWLCSKETQSFTRDSGRHYLHNGAKKTFFEVEFLHFCLPDKVLI